jgi:hypothetical protein
MNIVLSILQFVPVSTISFLKYEDFEMGKGKPCETLQPAHQLYVDNLEQKTQSTGSGRVRAKGPVIAFFLCGSGFSCQTILAVTPVRVFN